MRGVELASIEWFFKMVGGNKGKILNSLKNHIGKQIFADEKSGHHSRTQDNRTEGKVINLLKC